MTTTSDQIKSRVTFLVKRKISFSAILESVGNKRKNLRNMITEQESGITGTIPNRRPFWTFGPWA